MPPRARANGAAATNGAGSAAASLRQAGEDFLAAAGRDQPEGMLSVIADAHAFPDVIGDLAKAMEIRYNKATEMPFSPAIKEVYAQVAAAQRVVQQAAAEIGPLIEAIHREEIDKLRNPRVNEHMWDQQANRSAA